MIHMATFILNAHMQEFQCIGFIWPSEIGGIPMMVLVVNFFLSICAYLSPNFLLLRLKASQASFNPSMASIDVYKAQQAKICHIPPHNIFRCDVEFPLCFRMGDSTNVTFPHHVCGEIKPRMSCMLIIFKQGFPSQKI